MRCPCAVPWSSQRAPGQQANCPSVRLFLTRGGSSSVQPEMLAWRLTGHTLVVTLEPCPMCAGAAVMARVSRLVFGAWNEEYGAAGSHWDLVRDRRLSHRVEVVPGVLAEECGTLVREFLERRR
jgi:tRNA(Arg) A34 adenosine deaminase TadA